MLFGFRIIDDPFLLAKLSALPASDEANDMPGLMLLARALSS